MAQLARIEFVSGVSSLSSDYALIEKFVNLPDLLLRVEDDRELLLELFMMFQEELPGLREALHQAMKDGDLERATETAHAFKGLLANLSMNRAASLAASIEVAARAGDTQKAGETLAPFDAELAASSGALDAFIEGSLK